MTKLCALCRSPLTDTNRSKEHIIPNALGGRKTTKTFICRSCNSQTGESWDSELVSQLQTFCTLLDIRRAKGRNQPLEVETLSGRQLTWHSDGSLTPRQPKFEKRSVGDKTHVKIHARSVADARRMLTDLARSRPEIDVEQLLSEMPLSEEYLQEPIQMSHIFGDKKSGRSIIKSCLALACEAGLAVDDCKIATHYLLSNGNVCFGYCNERDPLTNRPDKIPLHCVYICANPANGLILAYVEYFGFHKVMACLSDDYDGPAIECCYAVNPLTGKELDIDVVVQVSREDIAAIYSDEYMNYERAQEDLKAALAVWFEIDRTKAVERAVDDAVKYACSQMNLQADEKIPENRISEFSNLVVAKMAPLLLRLRFGQSFTPAEMQQISRILGYNQES